MRITAFRWLLPAMLVALAAAGLPAVTSASTSAKPKIISRYDGGCLQKGDLIPQSLARHSGLVELIAMSGRTRIKGNDTRLGLEFDGVLSKWKARTNCWVLIPMSSQRVCLHTGYTRYKSAGTSRCPAVKYLNGMSSRIFHADMKPAPAVKVQPKPKVTPAPAGPTSVVVYVKINVPAANCGMPVSVRFFPGGLPSRFFPSCRGARITTRVGAKICQVIKPPMISTDQCITVYDKGQQIILNQWVRPGEDAPPPQHCGISPDGSTVHITVCALGSTGVQWQASQDDPDGGWEVAPCHLWRSDVGEAGNHSVTDQIDGIKPGSTVIVTCKAVSGDSSSAQLILPH